MHTLKFPALITLLACACTTDAGPSTDAASTGATTDVTVTSSASTHDSDHHEASTDHATGTTADTHADHGTADHGSETHGSETHGSETHGSETHGSETHGETTAGDTPAAQYCACMLENCHDQYHATWGEEHPDSETMCLAAAEAVPSVGMPAMSGNSIECRLHFCELGHDDPAACDTALGTAPCAD